MKIEELIKRAVDNVIFERMVLNEMGFDLSQYRNKINELTPNIIIHWCLIRYTTLFSDMVKYRKHWQEELRGWLNLLHNAKIKNGNKLQTKVNEITNMWFENGYEFNTDKEAIVCIISKKFKEEGLAYDNIVDTLAEEFMKNSEILANIIVGNNSTTPDEYVDTI